MTPAIPTPRLANPPLPGTGYFPDKLRCHITEEHVKDEVDQIVYSNREKQVVREKRFAHFADSQRFWLIKERYSCGNQADDKKSHEIIADEKNQHRREFRVIHGGDTNFAARRL